MLSKLIHAFTAPPEKPEDLKRFEAAREKLIKKAQAFEQECDTFGSLVEDMRGTRKRGRPNGRERK